jgi:hypothetical protein
MWLIQAFGSGLLTMRFGRQWKGGAVAVAVALTSAACSLLLDHDATQCHSSADCARTGTRLICLAGVCAPAGDAGAGAAAGPPGCFSGTPTTLSEFLNQCTMADYDTSFDDCARLGLCGPDAAGPALVPPPDAGTAMAVIPPPVPVETCQDPVMRPSVVYLNGSSNFIPLLQRLAPLLADAGVTPVFQQTNSCAAVRSMYGGASQRIMKDPATTGTGNYAQYYPTDGSPPQPCLLGSGGVTTDIGESEIFASTCSMGPVPGIAEFFGPIETMVFAVPKGSSENAITAAAAREVFGLGDSANNRATPWTDPRYYYVRNQNTATQQMMSHAIGVPADMFWGIDQGSAQNVQGSLHIVPPAQYDSAIGILGTDFYERDSGNLKALAFRATGQTAAYLPDSTAKARDKRNVRDGHYPIWGPLHFFTTDPPSTNAGTFLSPLAAASLSADILNAYVQSSFVPDCAMMVQRASELEDIQSYTPPSSCRCFFESTVPGGVTPPDCQACVTDGDCPNAKTCHAGFCE